MKIKLGVLRKGKGWTQPHTASLLGISLAYQKQLEYGKRTPSLEVAVKITKLFGCKSIDEIIYKDTLSVSQAKG